MHLDLCYTVWNCCTRSSRPQFFGKKGAFKIWQNSKLVFFTKKYRSRLQKETLTQVFSCKFCVISENTIINDHLKTICFCALNLEATLRICSEKCLFWINVSNFRKLPWVLLWKRNFYQNFGSSFSQTCVALKLILLYCKHSDLVLAKKKKPMKNLEVKLWNCQNLHLIYCWQWILDLNILIDEAITLIVILIKICCTWIFPITSFVFLWIALPAEF